MNSKLLPPIERLAMLPEENRQEALDWMASQPPARIDETVDPMMRWEVRISLSGVFDFNYIYDRATKEKKLLESNEDNW
jgi:hypothetical protein